MLRHLKCLEKTQGNKILDILLDAIAPTLTESLPIDNISKGDHTAEGNDCTLNQYSNRYSDIEQIYREHWEMHQQRIYHKNLSNIFQRTGRLMRLISTTYGEDAPEEFIEQDKNVREATSELINDRKRLFIIEYMLREIAFLKMRKRSNFLNRDKFEKRKEKVKI